MCRSCYIHASRRERQGQCAELTSDFSRAAKEQVDNTILSLAVGERTGNIVDSFKVIQCVDFDADDSDDVAIHLRRLG